MSTFLSFLFPFLGALAGLVLGYRRLGIWVGAGVGAIFSLLVFYFTGF